MGSTMDVTLLYKTSWSEAFIHYSLDGGSSWTKAPGDRLEECRRLKGWKEVNFQARGDLLFVPNDGGSSWDHPPGEKGDYRITASGTHVLKSGRVTPLTLQGVEPVLVVSDLDGTMIGDDAGTKAFADIWLRELAHREGKLVYNTGRSLDAYLQVQREKGLPTPSALITAVGTEIYWMAEDGTPSLDHEWEQSLSGNGWNREAVREVCDELVASELAHYRPPEEQLKFKIVLGVLKSNVDRVLGTLEEKLAARGAKAKFVYSGAGDWRFLDILSPTAGKLSAMQRVRGRLGFPAERTVACGDSGNDIAMMEGEERAIIVGNAQTELLEWYRGNVAGTSDRIYLGTERCAFAILQGLRHMKFVADN